MANDNDAPEGAVRPYQEQADSLNSEARVLAYLRAAMLESGDDPHAMAVVINNVAIARARLQRKEPLRVTASSLVVRSATKHSR